MTAALKGGASDFLAAHRDLFPESSPAGQAFAAIAAAAANIHNQATAKLLTGTDGSDAKAAARSDLQQLLRAIARTARVAAAETPGADAVFRMPGSTTGVALLTAAQAFLRHAETAGSLAGFGVSDAMLAELRTKAAAYDKASAEWRVGRSSAADAQTQIERSIADGMKAVRKLDVLIANEHRGNAALLDHWARSHRLPATSKASGTVEPSPEPLPTTPTDDTTLAKAS